MQRRDSSLEEAATAPPSRSMPARAETAGYGIRPEGYRLPGETHIGRVRLQVADLARSLEYYQSVLGFRVLHRTGGDATLGASGAETPLLELRERAGARPAPLRGRLGLYHFAVLLPDRPALGRFAAHLGELSEHAGSADHLVSEALYLRDPDGLGIEVYTDRARERWQRLGRELLMDTRPLDIAALVQAAGGESWTGMPPGTLIGHVHLHVGDIARAAAFYHTGLGLDKVVWSYPGALFMSAGGYHHHLGVNTWAGRDAAPPGEGDAGLLEWELALPQVADADAAAHSLEAHGYDITRAGDGWRAQDPWSTALRLTSAQRRE